MPLLMKYDEISSFKFCYVKSVEVCNVLNNRTYYCVIYKWRVWCFSTRLQFSDSSMNFKSKADEYLSNLIGRVLQNLTSGLAFNQSGLRTPKNPALRRANPRYDRRTYWKSGIKTWNSSAFAINSFVNYHNLHKIRKLKQPMQYLQKTYAQTNLYTSTFSLELNLIRFFIKYHMKFINNSYTLI